MSNPEKTQRIQKRPGRAAHGLTAPTGSGSWTYSRYRATLRKNGRFFAIVTPDGSEVISRQAEKELLAALNRSPNEKTAESRVGKD
jgi:hypothetical protein